MTSAKAIEYRIIQGLLARHGKGGRRANTRFADKLILVAAIGTAVLVMGSLSRELLLGLMAVSAVLTLGFCDH